MAGADRTRLKRLRVARAGTITMLGVLASIQKLIPR